MAAHILLVDDDKDFQDVIATKLRASGFEIAVANDGEEAVKKAAEVKPEA
jgi:CheY-like chemotaxis protein